jgi:hypothetical protein
MPGSLTPGALGRLAIYAAKGIAFRLVLQRRRPIHLFRRSISQPGFPILTLHRPPRWKIRLNHLDKRHIARGQCGSLLLSLEGLAPKGGLTLSSSTL